MAQRDSEGVSGGGGDAGPADAGASDAVPTADAAAVTHALSPPPPVIGRIIGSNFRVLKLIGSGAMGHVFQAEQLSLGKMVALKLLRRELQGDEKLIKRFELEAKNASSLDHPNSIQIIDFGRDGDLLFIAMELLPGVDLGQLILREGPLPLARLGRIMDQVLGALGEAHAHGIVHRDLKPGNIMLVSRRDDPDFVKVCDFGIAKAQSSPEGAGLTLKGLVCGTPEYMSPEQARGEEVDGRSDLYAVGVILYQLVTGELPFTASSPVGILSKHLGEAPVRPSLKRPGLRVPPALEAVILHALAKDPVDRPRSADHLRRALRAALAELGDSLLATPAIGQRAPETFDALGSQATTPMGLSAARAGATQPGRGAGGETTRPLHAARSRRRLWPAVGAAALIAASLWLARRGPTPMVSPEAPSAAGLAPLESANPAPVPQEPAAAPAAAATAGPSPGGTQRDDAPDDADPAKRRDAGRRRARPRPAPGVTAPPATTIDEPEAAAEPPMPSEPAAARPRAVAGAHDALKEAERLLADGDIAAACQRGEDQARATPAAAHVYKFLGKCYMRAGQAAKAMPHYRRYLELAPDASDAAFIRSIVR